MPTKTTTDIRFYKVIGSELQEDGKFMNKAREVKDITGATMDQPAAPNFEYHETNQEIPRGTIVKVENVHTRTITINPAS